MSMTDLDVPAILDRTGLPGMVSRAAQMVAEGKTAAEILEGREAAGAGYDAAKRAGRLAKAKGAHDDLIARLHRTQADFLDIEAAAKRKLADEYDAAQERGEVAKAGNIPDRNNSTVADIGLTSKVVHEARQIRDAEAESPGIVRRALDAMVERGEEPTRAKLRRTVKPEATPAPTRPGRGRAAIIQRVRDAISALSGLPSPSEVMGYFAGTDDAVLVNERLPSASRWLADFAELWPEEDMGAEAAE